MFHLQIKHWCELQIKKHHLNIEPYKPFDRSFLICCEHGKITIAWAQPHQPFSFGFLVQSLHTTSWKVLPQTWDIIWDICLFSKWTKYLSSGYPSNHATFYFLQSISIYLFIFILFIQHSASCQHKKNIASDEEGPSWVFNMYYSTVHGGVRGLNEVYCLKTGLAAWPSCSSKNWLRNFQFWNCHDNFHSTVAQVFGARGTVNNWLTTTVKQLALKCLGFHMPYALCICAVRPPLITSCTITALQGAEWEKKADTWVSRTSGMNPAFTRDRKQSTYPTHSFSKST